MLNSAIKKEAVAAFEKEKVRYEFFCDEVKAKAEALYEVRRSSSEQLIVAVENYINELANSPKEFDKTFSEYRAQFKDFSQHTIDVESFARSSGIQIAGIAAMYVFTFAPTLVRAGAPALATTIPGAAPFMAPIAAASAGPVGWAVGIASLIAGGYSMRIKNTKLAEEAVERRKELVAINYAIQVSLTELMLILTLTKDHVEGVEQLFTKVRVYAPRDYTQFDEDQRQQLATLINHVNSLSVLLNKQVEVGNTDVISDAKSIPASNEGASAGNIVVGMAMGAFNKAAVTAGGAVKDAASSLTSGVSASSFSFSSLFKRKGKK